MSKQIVDAVSETFSFNQYEFRAKRIAELERENAELRRQNRIWECRVDSIIRLIDGRELEECPK